MNFFSSSGSEVLFGTGGSLLYIRAYVSRVHVEESRVRPPF